VTLLDKTAYRLPEYKKAVLEFPALPVPYAMTRTDRVSVKRYYDPEFYAAENDLLWSRVWQMACFLAEIPNPGDYTTYEILGKSIIIVRVDDKTVRAFHNACRHRGVEVVAEGSGNVKSGFTCPFHGWCYGLDGKNTFLYQPDLFDESNRQAEDLALVPCRVEIWGPSAFINLDDSAPPLRECIEPFASFHDVWKAEGLWPEWWLSCRMPTNWKLAMEAFMEGYHVMQTHPQLYPKGRSRTIFREVGKGRMASGTTFTVGHGIKFDRDEFVQQQLHFMRDVSVGMAGMTHAKDVRVAEGLVNLDLPDDVGGAIATWYGAVNQAVMEWHTNQGIDMPDLHKIAEQGLNYGVNFCFPHFFLLPTYSSSSAYRIRPLGPEECLFELWSLTRYPPGQEPAAPPRPTPMAPDDVRWPPIPAQDYSNLPIQQKGLHAQGFEYMRLSGWVEGMISNYQRVIDGYLAGLPYQQLVPAMQQVSGPIETESRDVRI
jgi:phenylpropionate dioxygenase-like ring-hydroxylating dioxygenase large terminal subunit